MNKSDTRWRYIVLVVFVMSLTTGIIARLIDIGVINRTFLLKQGQARSIRTVSIPAQRGIITSQKQLPLAISTHVASVWFNPQKLEITHAQRIQLAHILNQSPAQLKTNLTRYHKREFAYLDRHIPPQTQQAIAALNIPGIYFQQESKRYYPEGEVDAHVVGFTNIDDVGQEGIELAYNNWLAGTPGKKEVIKDRLGHIIANIKQLKAPKQGHTLHLSLNQSIQYQAYHTLLNTVNRYHADSGTVIVLDTQKHHILAMTNVPSYNPNSRPVSHDGRYRNRAVTDVLEPGSTIKPFTLSFALESGKYTPDSLIDTRPGWMVLDGYTIEDTSDHGVINLTQLLQKSSNIGAAKVMLSLDGDQYPALLRKLGFGERTHSGFPGEVSGTLPYHFHWRKINLATLAYGYGLAVTPLQLAHAYSILANGGCKYQVSFLNQAGDNPCQRVLPKTIAHTMLSMMETVTEPGGTGVRAHIPGYRVAGKTGTAHMTSKKGYDANRYIASFIGIAPISNPHLVVAVIITNPKPEYYGGVVAAPVFATVMSAALQQLHIPPDALNKTPAPGNH